jgi:hypothetical protein
MLYHCVGISDRAHYYIQAVYLVEVLERSVIAHSSGSVMARVTNKSHVSIFLRQ